MFKKFWRFVSSVGILPTYPERKIKRVMLINQYILIAALLYIINGVSDLFLGLSSEGISLIVASFMFIIPMYLNKRHYHRFTVVFLFFYISITIFYFGVVTGVQSGDYLYYFPLILAISFAFDFTKDKWLMVFLFFFILSLIILSTFSYNVYAGPTDYTQRWYKEFVLNLILSSVTLGSFIYLSAKNNDMVSQLYEQRLKEKEASEVLIKKALTEKEVLLAELHHRVKNNLAVMVAFFNLKLSNTQNEEAKSILQESRNRVNSMALIHNHLYHKDDFSEINFGTYITDLVKEIETSYPAISKSVKVESNILNIKLNLNTAIPCALILNELLTNCYKHAFKDRISGNITIDFSPLDEQHLKLKVKDDGHGLAKNYDTNNSMGLSVIQSLTEQLNGKHSYVSDKGTCFELVFNPGMV